jgi:hypothetical protein
VHVNLPHFLYLGPVLLFSLKNPGPKELKRSMKPIPKAAREVGRPTDS